MSFRKKINNLNSLIVRIGVLISIVIFVFSVYRLWHPVELDCSAVVGWVLEDSSAQTVCREGGYMGPSCRMVAAVKYAYEVKGVSYKDVSYSPIRRTDGIDDNKIFHKGEQVLVYFQKANPAVSSLNPFQQNNNILYALIGFSVLFFIMGINQEKRK